MATKLVEARQRLGEKQKLVETVLEECGDNYDFTKVKALGEDKDTQAKVEAFRALNVELGELVDECKHLEFEEYANVARRVREEWNAPVTPPVQPDPNAAGVKSLGERFIESDEYQQYKVDHVRDVPAIFDDIDLKTLFETSAGWAPESTRIGRVVEAVTRPIQVLDLLPLGQTGQPSVVYMEETTRTHAAAEAAEGTAFAESTFQLTERSSPVRKVTDSVPVTDEQLEDEAQVRSYLDLRLRFGVRQRLDGQVLNGDGVAPNLKGILNTAGIQTQAKAADPVFDAIHKAMTKVLVTGRAIPGAVVLNPFNWETIRLTRTADGIYIMGNPADPGPRTLFGVPVALGDVIASGTGLVGDFQNFAQLWERRGVEIRIGYVNDQFKTGQQTLRGDVRVALTVYRPAAFCTVTGLV